PLHGDHWPGDGRRSCTKRSCDEMGGTLAYVLLTERLTRYVGVEVQHAALGQRADRDVERAAGGVVDREQLEGGGIVEEARLGMRAEEPLGRLSVARCAFLHGPLRPPHVLPSGSQIRPRRASLRCFRDMITARLEQGPRSRRTLGSVQSLASFVASSRLRPVVWPTAFSGLAGAASPAPSRRTSRRQRRTRGPRPPPIVPTW